MATTEKLSGPASRAANTVTLTTHNTLTLAAGEVYQLVASFAGPYGEAYYFNILNLGPGTLYLRDNGDPDPDDPETETLPSLVADNLIAISDGSPGLRVMADQDGKITVRLVRGGVY